MRNPIGTKFKKENIVLAMVDYPLTYEEAKPYIRKLGYEDIIFLDGMNIWILNDHTFFKVEYDIFYKAEDGYIRFWENGNEIFAGDDSDGKGRLYHIVSAWKFFREEQMYERLNKKGELSICCCYDLEDNPLMLYNRRYSCD